MTWAKIDTALHRNPKVRMAGRNARDVYVFVLLANADGGADGELNSMILDPHYLADQLQCSVEDATDGVKRCATFQLLHVTGSIVAICGWDNEWKVKTSTDRVRKHRSKKKQEVTSDETLRNVSGVSCNGETPREIDREMRPRISKKMLEDVYSSYPCKKGKAKGLERAAKIIKTASQFEAFKACVEAMARDFAADNTFCPHFSTFVNGRLWEDEQSPSPAKLRIVANTGQAKPMARDTYTETGKQDLK